MRTGLRSRERHATEVPPSRHRPDEHAGSAACSCMRTRSPSSAPPVYGRGRVDREHGDGVVAGPRRAAPTRAAQRRLARRPARRSGRSSRPSGPRVDTGRERGQLQARRRPRPPRSRGPPRGVRAPARHGRARRPPSVAAYPPPHPPPAGGGAAPGIAWRASRSERQYSRCRIRAGSSTIGHPGGHHGEVHLLALESMEQRGRAADPARAAHLRAGGATALGRGEHLRAPRRRCRRVRPPPRGRPATSAVPAAGRARPPMPTNAGNGSPFTAVATGTISQSAPVQGSAGKKSSSGEFHRKWPNTARAHSRPRSSRRRPSGSVARRDTTTPTAMPTSPV